MSLQKRSTLIWLLLYVNTAIQFQVCLAVILIVSNCFDKLVKLSTVSNLLKHIDKHTQIQTKNNNLHMTTLTQF